MTLTRFVQRAFLGLGLAALVGGVALPASAAEKKAKKGEAARKEGDNSKAKGAAKEGNAKGDRPNGNRDNGPPSNQSEAAQQSLDRQKAVAAGLREKATSDPSTLQAMIDDLRQQLADESARHDAAVARYTDDIRAAGSDKKQSSRAKRSLDDENRSFASRKASLERQIAALQAKLDNTSGGSTPAPTSPPASESPGVAPSVPSRPEAPSRLQPPPRPQAP